MSGMVDFEGSAEVLSFNVKPFTLTTVVNQMIKITYVHKFLSDSTMRYFVAMFHATFEIYSK